MTWAQSALQRRWDALYIGLREAGAQKLSECFGILGFSIPGTVGILPAYHQAMPFYREARDLYERRCSGHIRY